MAGAAIHGEGPILIQCCEIELMFEPLLRFVRGLPSSSERWQLVDHRCSAPALSVRENLRQINSVQTRLSRIGCVPMIKPLLPFPSGIGPSNTGATSRGLHPVGQAAGMA